MNSLIAQVILLVIFLEFFNILDHIWNQLRSDNDMYYDIVQILDDHTGNSHS